MDSLSLFDLPVRTTDPSTSREAAQVSAAGNAALIRTIVRVVTGHGPVTSFEIADAVERLFPGRWDSATIRTAVSRAGLKCADEKGVSPRGRRCTRYLP